MGTRELFAEAAATRERDRGIGWGSRDRAGPDLCRASGNRADVPDEGRQRSGAGFGRETSGCICRAVGYYGGWSGGVFGFRKRI